MSTIRDMSGWKIYLVYHIYEGLRVVLREAMDRITCVLTSDDNLNQGEEFLWSELAPDQTSTG